MKGKLESSNGKAPCEKALSIRFRLGPSRDILLYMTSKVTVDLLRADCWCNPEASGLKVKQLMNKFGMKTIFWNKL